MTSDLDILCAYDDLADDVRVHDLIDSLSGCAYEVASADFIYWGPGRTINAHLHDDLVHLDLFIGSGMVILGQRRLPIKGATIVLIPTFLPHRFATTPTGRMKNHTVKMRVSGELDTSSLPMIVLRHPDESLATRMRDGLIWLLEEQRMRPPGYASVCDGILRNLLISVIRAAARLYGPPTNSVLEEACAIIATEYMHDIQVRDISARCGIRPDSLCRLFRTHLKMSPRDYLRKIRLEQAVALLKTGYSVTHVAKQTGFASIHYFSRVFASAFHCPPTRFASKSQALGGTPKA